MTIKTLGDFDILPEELAVRIWSFDSDELRKKEGSFYAAGIQRTVKLTLTDLANRVSKSTGKAPQADFVIFRGDSLDEDDVYSVAITRSAGSRILSRFGADLEKYASPIDVEDRTFYEDLPLKAVYRYSNGRLICYLDDHRGTDPDSGLTFHFRELLEAETARDMLSMMPDLLE